MFITAPTGSGKTYFILNTLLPYARERNWNILYLVNRKILKEQLEEDVKEIDNQYFVEGKRGVFGDQSPVIENEIPILMDGEDYYQYVYYAIDKIVSAYNDGIVLAEGTVYLQ